MYHNKTGFTLLELLIVVLVIAILSAIAIPQYQRAVYKSRFQALMPVAREIYQGNELYYLTNGHYATSVEDLDLKTQAQYPVGSTVTLQNGDSYTYVIAQRPDVNNNYVVYQEHSKQFPGNIHCEAKKDDSKAIWLCEKALQGEKIERGSLTPGYISYVLRGSASDGALASTYTNESGVALSTGDVCEGTQEGACSNLTAEGATCTGNGQNACSNSTYEESTCQGNQATACSNSSFTDSACIANGQGACMGSDFTDSTCTGNTGGTSASNTSCGSGSVYTRSECRNLSSNGYSCGRSTYQDGSKCYSNDKGGCGKSTFSGGSKCYGESNTACDNSTFTGNSVCIANAYDACKGGTYKDTSYCEGNFCPAGSPTSNGGTWCRGSDKTQHSYVCE